MEQNKRYQRTEDEQKRCIEIHDKFREELLKRQLSNSEGYDKAILSLSSAGLALSLTAIRFIVPLETATYLWAIKLSWVLFLFTVISTLIAYLVGNQAISKELTKAERYYVQGVVDAHLESNLYQKANHILNRATGVFFAVAISLVVFFVIINIQGETNMSDKKQTSKRVFVTDSADIPSMQLAPESKEVPIYSADIPKMEMAPGTAPTSEHKSAESASSSKDSKS
ncbi:hypothetical protein VIOR3934_02697 [Vibrio orientalis CIP 102891 = ATCC 33934]|uniref:Uncharacterized protein n=1 Tax=Vibrio orientalis CIP 102891 = ATCC 33934 TaxID=675816 RepID=C9QK79_VIBOR|nr:hypothetical protein [Vibrio orientalis]EEX92074.1 hypothetical protein VIA_002718 [Vibrio orientalis CIP 102891 = ATCC 33934]EGU47242.1 hypothetical protein VIOR3934_02697 [Vibrio orientalis CIP 102891 = ATCC 33934]